MTPGQSRHPFDWLQRLIQSHRRAILLILLFLLLAGTVAYFVVNSSCSNKGNSCMAANDLIVFISSLGGLTMLLQLILPASGTHLSQSVQKLAANSTSLRNILDRPLLTDPKTFEQLESDVEEVYDKLTQLDITAVILTGIVGVGKSTLASLIYEHARRQRLADIETFFNLEPLWLKVDRDVTMADFINTLFKALRIPLPDLHDMTSENQALVLLRALNSGFGRRLIILDEFDTLLDRQTGYILPDRPGLGQWLDAINSNSCHCRLLLTSRLWPRGTHDYPPTYLEEYIFSGLEEDDGVQLLKKQGLEVSDDDLRKVSKYYNGHAGALKELASVLRSDPNLSAVLAFTTENAEYTQLRRRLAHRLLDPFYKAELNESQREVMLAFSVYREPVTLETVREFVNFRGRLPNTSLRPAVDVLLVHHLLQACGELRYQLHPLITDYAQGLFDENDEDANTKALQNMHARVAQYYRQLKYPTRGNRLRASDIHPLIEASWHLCQAQQLQEAFDLLYAEGIFSNLDQFKDHDTITELCLQFLPFEKWEPERWKVNQLNRTFKEACLELGKEELAAYYDSLVVQWQRQLG